MIDQKAEPASNASAKSSIFDPQSSIPPKRPFWTVVATLLWSVLLAALFVRAGLRPGRPTSLTTYLAGGSAWNASQPLYTNWRGFVYPPLVAWFFGIVAHLPLAVGGVLWRVLAAGTFLWGLGALLRSGVFHRIPRAFHGLVFIGVLPLSIGNIDNAQANPLIAGLIMLAIAALQRESLWLCAVAIGIATTFKIYPVAVALLLCVLRPRRLGWRLALVIMVLAALPFAFQAPHYVAGQYAAWMRTRLADDRFQYPAKDAPLDLWYLLVRVGVLPVSESAYAAFQLLAAAALAALIWRQKRGDVALRDSLASLFLLGCVWMLLLGPATENQTYVVLAPAACLLAVESFALPHSRLTRCLSLAAFALLLAAVARNSFAPHVKGPISMAIQPAAAMVLLPAILTSTRGQLSRRGYRTAEA